MDKFFDRVNKLFKKKEELKELEEQKKVTQLLITFGKSPEWQSILEMITNDKEQLEAMQGDAMEKSQDRLANILYGQIKQCNKYLNLIKDCEENLSEIDNQINLNQEVKNG